MRIEVDFPWFCLAKSTGEWKRIVDSLFMFVTAVKMDRDVLFFQMKVHGLLAKFTFPKSVLEKNANMLMCATPWLIW